MTAVEDPFFPSLKGGIFSDPMCSRFKIPHVRRASLFPRSAVNKS